MRLAESQCPSWVMRSKDPKPVEGNSEIALVLSTRNPLGFIEAKLGSDVSMTTTYDPARNATKSYAISIVCWNEPRLAPPSSGCWLLTKVQDERTRSLSNNIGLRLTFFVSN